MISRERMPSLIEMPANPEAMPVANGLMVEPRVPIPQPEQDDRGAGHGVVAGGDHHRDHERVEREALLGHAVRRAAEGEDDHQDRDHPAFPAAELGHQPRDAGLDRPGPHGHAQEAADHDDEQGDVDGPEQDAVVVVADVALVVLDPVEPVDRGGQGVDQDALGIAVDRGVGPRDRCPVLVQLVGARRDDPGEDGHQDDQREEDGVGRRQGEPVATLRRCGRGRVSHGSLLRVGPAAWRYGPRSSQGLGVREP